MRPKIRFVFPFIFAFLLLASADRVLAQTIYVPNGSFESPETPFADPSMSGWQKSPEPFWYAFSGSGFPWDQLIGQFQNTPAGDSNHIDNVDGSQAAFLFASPDVGIFQDYNSLTGTTGVPTHQFNARFESGKAYTLTVGVLGGGGGMSNGTTFQISLYYRDMAGSRVTIGATTITNSSALFPTNTYLTDFQVRIPKVQASDAWAGKHIGIELASTVGFDLAGGYWDVDNVRLTESVVPNNSFESPTTAFAGPEMDGWQKSPEPFWYAFSGSGFPWDQLMGQFLNTPVGYSNHIDNVEGSQAAFLFASPDVAIFQDYNSLNGTNATPSHDFNAKFEPGKSYALTVGVIGGGGGMSNGTTFQISLYYRDGSSNKVTVTSTTITNSPTLFPNNTHFIDFQAIAPTVKAGDAWANKNIGIELASTVGFELAGGYWDIDNVRLTESVVVNNSFELPATDFASPVMDSWQKAPEPLWYTFGGGGFPWDQLMGQFLNTPDDDSNHIDNLEGRQAAFLFALPNVAIFQDTNTVFTAGKSYNLTVGVLGGGGGMSNGTTFQISLYYRDASNNIVTVAATTITNTPTAFPTNTHFTDFNVIVPTVKSSDAWAGKQIGVQLASTVGFELMGGYWDVDNVRLREVQDTILTGMIVTNNQPQFTVKSTPGRYEIFAVSDLAVPATNWTSLGTITNLTGSFSFSDTNASAGLRFYEARQSP